MFKQPGRTRVDFRKHRLFVYAIVDSEFDSTKPLKDELLRIKQRIVKALNTDKITLQDLG